MPAPDGRGSGPPPDAVTSLILDGLREVKESLTRLSADVSGQLSRLPELYMPRREIEHRLDEHTIDIGALEAKLAARANHHDDDVRRLTALVEKAEKERRAERDADDERREGYRRWVIGVSVPALLTLIGLVIAVLTRT